MGRTKSFFIKLAYIAIDVCCIYLVIYASCLMRHKLITFPVDFSHLLIDPANPFRHILVFWILATIFFLNDNGLYQTRRELLEGIEVWEVIKSVIFGSLVTIGAIYALKIHGFPRTVFMNVMLGMMVVLSLWRVAKRLFVEYLVSHGYNNFNVLIVGAGKVGIALAQEIEQRPALGLKIAGFLDDFKNNEPGQKDLKVLGKISDFAEVARRQFIHKIFITIHHDSQVFLSILQQAREMGIAVRVIPQGFDLITGEFAKYNIGFVPVLEYCDVSYARRQVGKRVFDFIFSLLGILATWPLFIFIGLIIKLDSPGPVFYVSKRYGRRGKIFHMYKFRSMTQDADRELEKLLEKNEVDGPIFKIKFDPRVTRVGAILRKFSLDELPQIINVLQGEMSLVGPRPFPIAQIEKEDLNQLKRLEVRPGITGLWQIRGRSDISFSRLVKWDIWYINNWSLWLDLNIILQTVPVVLKGKGAY
ncbi:MAG: hypothetical protein A3D10_05625 [Omnitrophica WOR_2 bacterium RIFCSPHIGHO2_02_FULL_48_11]|nr:MAG: hypothetical protein A3D10_05625 [Omnitrophica WOR_2 bacterium RIFCSPHIGHO2_02_FULL_48_11]